MKLYATTTSPFARRVRVIAAELGVLYEMVSTATPEGERELRRRTPLWKVPTVVVDDAAGERILWDSRAITRYLLERHGPGPFAVPAGHDPWHEENLLNAIDGALDSAINAFYFERDGITREKAPYVLKQLERSASALAWVEGQLKGTSFSQPARFGLAELALVTTLDWMVFRDRYPVAQHPRLVAFQQAHAGRPSLRATYPATS